MKTCMLYKFICIDISSEKYIFLRKIQIKVKFECYFCILIDISYGYLGFLAAHGDV